MKHLKKLWLGLAFCLLVGSLWLVFAHPEAKPQSPEVRLAMAEQELAEGREALTALLRAHYMGQASEAEAARLIEQVEEARLRVEAIRAELTAL